ncbi:MAG: hypothetical protein K2L19_04540 [Eubacterium sp.]|nr:hypothetical protein [Eubacterium sp.]
MKKSKKLLILASAFVLTVLAVCAIVFCQKAASPIKENKNKYDNVISIDDYSIEYNGKVYRYFDESKYYELIKDEKIYEKKDSMFPETYYTLKNDDNHDFIYVGVFRDSELYTALPISDYNDVIKGEPTSIIISKLGYEIETEQISDNPAAIEEAVAYKTFEYSAENLKTYNKRDHDGWYYIYVFYDNLPIASNVTGITIVDYHGEYMLLCSTTDNTYSGIIMEKGALTDLIENMKMQQYNP